MGDENVEDENSAKIECAVKEVLLTDKNDIPTRPVGTEHNSEWDVLCSKVNDPYCFSDRIRIMQNSNWPKIFDECGKSPVAMARAGFTRCLYHSYREGYASDAVFCFCCGQGIENWKVYDNPFTAHLNWTRRKEKYCPFIEKVFEKEKKLFDPVRQLYYETANQPPVNECVSE